MTSLSGAPAAAKGKWNRAYKKQSTVLKPSSMAQAYDARQPSLNYISADQSAKVLNPGVGSPWTKLT